MLFHGKAAALDAWQCPSMQLLCRQQVYFLSMPTAMGDPTAQKQMQAPGRSLHNCRPHCPMATFARPPAFALRRSIQASSGSAGLSTQVMDGVQKQDEVQEKAAGEEQPDSALQAASVSSCGRLRNIKPSQYNVYKAAGVCFFRLHPTTRELEVLLVKQKEQWTFPGGKRKKEIDKSPARTAAREVEEETHYLLKESLVLKLLREKRTQWNFSGRYVLYLTHLPKQVDDDVPGGVAKAIAEGNTHPEAEKLTDAAWVPLIHLHTSHRSTKNLPNGERLGHIVVMLLDKPVIQWLESREEELKTGLPLYVGELNDSNSLSSSSSSSSAAVTTSLSSLNLHGTPRSSSKPPRAGQQQQGMQGSDSTAGEAQGPSNSTQGSNSTAVSNSMSSAMAGGPSQASSNTSSEEQGSSSMASIQLEPTSISTASASIIGSSTAAHDDSGSKGGQVTTHMSSSSPAPGNGSNPSTPLPPPPLPPPVPAAWQRWMHEQQPTRIVLPPASISHGSSAALQMAPAGSTEHSTSTGAQHQLQHQPAHLAPGQQGDDEALQGQGTDAGAGAGTNAPLPSSQPCTTSSDLTQVPWQHSPASSQSEQPGQGSQVTEQQAGNVEDTGPGTSPPPAAAAVGEAMHGGGPGATIGQGADTRPSQASTQGAGSSPRSSDGGQRPPWRHHKGGKKRWHKNNNRPNSNHHSNQQQRWQPSPSKSGAAPWEQKVQG